MMDMKKSKKLLLWLAAMYWMLVLVIYLVAGEQFRYTQISSDPLSPGTTVGELVDGVEVRQMIQVPADSMTSFSLMTAAYNRSNSGEMTIELLDEQGEQVALQRKNVSEFADGQYTLIMLDAPVEGRKGETLMMVLTTQGCTPGNAITVYAGNTITAGRFDIVKSISQEELYTVNGQAGVGKLCVQVNGIEALNFYKTYWVIVTGIFAVVSLVCVRWWKQAAQGKNNPLVTGCMICTRYSFLIQQLVGRDFKAKYKRSVLGVAWSFLNPLMTMAVQYMIFSTLFRSNIPNYPVYLLTGTVFFNFFNEAVSLGMVSITGNAHLIKKVYMPRYIYPIAKVLFSLVNFSFALIPLVLVIIFTGTKLSPSLFLLVFDVLCMIGFVMGMVLILSVFMTFFQDTQFLWNVVSMMWMYATPIFYPESIIPQRLLTFYHMNPMYQYITFARTVILDGVSPAPSSYLWCLLSSVVVLLVGVKVFSKYQDELVMHL